MVYIKDIKVYTKYVVVISNNSLYILESVSSIVVHPLNSGSSRMMLVGLMVLSISGLVVTQQETTCECIAYFVCGNRTWDLLSNCQHYNEICCEIDPVINQPNPKTTKDGKVCGKRKPVKQPDPVEHVIWKVDLPEGVSGSTSPGEFTWMVAIFNSTPSGQSFVCGGSIIYPNMILTTAHSISGIPASDLSVKAGVWNTADPSEVSKHQDRKVIASLIHPGYDRSKLMNDFALLVLDEILTVNDNVAPVCLPSPNNRIDKTSCVATGWGKDKYGNSNGTTLKKVTVPLVDSDECQNKLRATTTLGPSFNLHDSFICAGGASYGDTCVGDGGGPLMCLTTDNPDNYVQVGITSWGTGCGGSAPGVYSSVQAAAEWIQQQSELYPPIIVKIDSP